MISEGKKISLVTGIFFLLCLSSMSFGVHSHFLLKPVEPEEGSIYVRHADRFESETVNGLQVRSFFGNVKIEHGETGITCHQATYFEHDNRVLLRGDVEILQPMRTIAADTVEYFERTREVVGHGDSVRIVDDAKGVTVGGGYVRYNLDSEAGSIGKNPYLKKYSEDDRVEATVVGDVIELYSHESRAVARGDSVRLNDMKNNLELCGKYVSYDFERKHAVATGRPRISKNDEGGSLFMTLMSDTVEISSEEELLKAFGDVSIEREGFRGEGGRAAFVDKGEKVILEKNPTLWQSTNKLVGDEIELVLEDWSVTKVFATGHAQATSTSESDSMESFRDVNELAGKEITLFLENEEAESLVVAGSATSVYHMREDQDQRAMNEASGDTITLFFRSGKIDNVRIVGGTRGTYFTHPAGGTETVDTVSYQSDRIDYDLDDGILLLLGENRIEYRNIVLTAGRISFNTATDILTAEGVADSAGHIRGNPVLKEGGEEIEGVWLDYDMKRRKGKIKKGETQFEKGFYKGEKIRKVTDRTLNIDHGIYTTCDRTKPHYHFYTRRMKFYQNDKVIAKPVVLYFGDVPVLALPFYIFPIKKGRHSGLLIPRYGSTDADGRYLRDAGYYYAPSEYWDVLGKFSFYEWTGWMFESRLRYALRYNFSGSVGGSYRWDKRYVGSSERKTKRWNFRFNHTHTITPSLTVKASGDFVSDASYYQDVSFNALERMERTLRSEVILDKRWQGSSLSLRINHERDLDRDRTTENLPVLTYRRSQRPFFGVGPQGSGGETGARRKWYHSLSYSYNVLFVNWDRKEGDDYERHVGADHRIDLTGPQTIGGWLHLTPRVNLRETWYDEDKEGNTWVRRGYYEASLSANTTLYGLFQPRIGPLTMVRHKVQPRLSFSYRPDFEKRGNYYSFGGIGSIPGPQKTVGVGLSHFFQGKTVTDQGENKFDIATLDMSSGYNFRAEGQKFRPVNTTLRVYPSKSINMDVNTTHSLYHRETGEFQPWQPALQNMSLTTTVRLTSREGGSSVGGVEEGSGDMTGTTSVNQFPEGERRGGGREKTGSGPWTLNLSHNYSLTKSAFTSKTQWLRGRAGLFLTKNWKIDYAATYDLEKSKFTAQQVVLYRDLHCWEAQFVWVPTGGREGYYFRINIKALPEVKIERGRGIGGFGL